MREDEFFGSRCCRIEYCTGCLGNFSAYSKGTEAPSFNHYKTSGHLHVLRGLLVSLLFPFFFLYSGSL